MLITLVSDAQKETDRIAFFFYLIHFFYITGYDQKYLYHIILIACKVTMELSWTLGTVR